MDQRLKDLVTKKETICTLKKQPRHLTTWFNSKVVVYDWLYKEYGPIGPMKDWLDRIFTLLKFVSKPNDPWRKESTISSYWPPLEKELEPFLSGKE